MRETIAVCNDRVLVREGNRLLVVPRGGVATLVLAVPLALVSYILSVNAATWIVVMVVRDASYWWVALLLFALASVSVAGFVWTVRRAKSMWMEPYGAEPILVIDLEHRTIAAGPEDDPAPLDTASVDRASDLFSSATTLVCNWPGGSVLVARSSPLRSGFTEIEQELSKHLASGKDRSEVPRTS